MKSIKDAYKELKGTLESLNSGSRETYLFHHPVDGDYLTDNTNKEGYGYKYICTVKEFNNYKGDDMKTINPYILLVMKWLNDRDSVTQEELDKNRDAAASAAASVAASAAASAAAYATYATASDAERWIGIYFERTGENKQYYIDELKGDDMKTTLDAVIEFKGDFPYSEPSIIEQISTGNFESWSEITDSELNTGNFRLTCTREEFNQCVEEMSKDEWMTSSVWLREPEKPVYTKAMCDAGELPSVGMECLVYNKAMLNASYEKCTVLFIGKFKAVYTSDSCMERVGSIDTGELAFKPLTPPIKLINGEAYQFDNDDCVVKGIYYKHNDVFITPLNDYLPEDCTNIQLLEVVKS